MPGQKWKEANAMNKEWRGWKFPGEFPKKQQLFLLLLVGILLVVIAIPTPEQKESLEKEECVERLEDTDLDGYRASLERELEEILAQTEGVGDVQVMITFHTSAEKIVEKDLEKSDSARQEMTVLQDTSDGAHTPYVRKEIRPQVEGVLISAEGGDHAVVRKEITEAVQALFGIETHKIKIMKQSDSKKEGSF